MIILTFHLKLLLNNLIKTTEHNYLKVNIVKQYLWQSALNSGDFLRYWQTTFLRKIRFDVPNQVMHGKMDPLFFRKGSIPHRYPCRDAFLANHAKREINLPKELDFSRLSIPLENNKLEASGFYYRATVVSQYARVSLVSETKQLAKFKLTTCGGVKIWLNSESISEFFPYTRNIASSTEISLALNEGENELIVYMDDLCERDVLFYISLESLGNRGLKTAIPIPIASDECEELINIVKECRLENIQCLPQDKLKLIFKEPLPFNIQLNYELNGETLLPGSQHQTSNQILLSKEQTEVILGKGADFAAGYANLSLSFQKEEFKLAHTLGVEIINHLPLLDSSEVETRSDFCLKELASQSTHHSVRPAGTRVLAQLIKNININHAEDAINQLVEIIDQRHDCADFDLVPLLWAYRLTHKEYPHLWHKFESCVVNFRYWMDEPGNDVMWYFSENHALLFHTSQLLSAQWFAGDIFTNSLRSAKEQQAVAEERLFTWFENFFSHEMAEWNSAPYFPIDLIGLLALYEWADNQEIKQQAKVAMDCLWKLIANASHQGYLAASQGRSYEKSLIGRRSNEISALIWLYFNSGNHNNGDRVLSLACLSNYRPPLELADLINYPHSDKAFYVCHSQAENNFAKLKQFKNADYSLATCVDYLIGEPGYQETLLQIALGKNPSSQIWLNHPGERTTLGDGRPSFWAGNGICPHVNQHENIAFIAYDIPTNNLVDFIHFYLPEHSFDQVILKGQSGFIAQENGYVAVLSSSPLISIKTGSTSNMEWRTSTDKGTLCIIMGNAHQYGSFSEFIRIIESESILMSSDEIQIKTGKFPSAHFKYMQELTINNKAINNNELCQLKAKIETLLLPCFHSI